MATIETRVLNAQTTVFADENDVISADFVERGDTFEHLAVVYVGTLKIFLSAQQAERLADAIIDAHQDVRLRHVQKTGDDTGASARQPNG